MKKIARRAEARHGGELRRELALQRQVDPRLPVRLDPPAPRHPAAGPLLPGRTPATRRDGQSALPARRHPTGARRHARRQAQPRRARRPRCPRPRRRLHAMEFGIFAQLFVPRFERDVDPTPSTSASCATSRSRWRPTARVEVRVVPRAPLPRRVLAHARAGGVPLLRRRAAPSACTSARPSSTSRRR